jgi:hypothetical protein
MFFPPARSASPSHTLTGTQHEEVALIPLSPAHGRSLMHSDPDPLIGGTHDEFTVLMSDIADRICKRAR